MKSIHQQDQRRMMMTDESEDDLKINNIDEIVVLGKRFNSEIERKKYFREELRKKLPDLKLLDGFPIGNDDDILNLSDPPFYTACPNPWINDFIKEWEMEKQQSEEKGKRSSDFKIDEPYAFNISEGKNNPVYMAHSYHTKVPHPAIMRYILHYTQPGDVIFDGFAGTGMTGVAASICANPDAELKHSIELENKSVVWGKRNAICNDLSPVASFIAYNYNNSLIQKNIDEIEKTIYKIEKEFSWLYKTKHFDNKSYGIINNVIWSEIYNCTNCNHSFTFWEAAVDRNSNTILNEFKCTHCDSLYQKSNISPESETVFNHENQESVSKLKLQPVLINYTLSGKRYEKIPDEEDLILLEQIKNIKVNNNDLHTIYSGDEIGRLSKHGIDNIRELIFRRSRIVFDVLQKEMGFDITFLITASAQNSSLLYRFRLNGKGGTTSGTYYICSTPQENNVFNSLKAKFRDIKKAFKLIKTEQLVSTGSATNNPIADNSIDYIFTDPPFGANLMYSELNLIMETWLGVITNSNSEAIANKFQNKNLYAYQELMHASFKEYHRILKPGKWMTVEFSNTSAAVWNSIQTSLQNAGFVIANVTDLDKKQVSFKAITTATAVKQDLAISCYKPSDNFDKKFRENQNSNIGVWDFIEEHLQHLPVHVLIEKATLGIVERTPKILFDRLIAFYVQRSLPVPIDSGVFQQGLRERFIERDGMFFTNEQVQEFDEKKAENPDFIQMSLFVNNEQDSIFWLRNLLEKTPKTESELHPLWMKEVVSNIRKGDVLPEMRIILEENFLKQDNGKWIVPDMTNEIQLEKIKVVRHLKLFETYKNEAINPKVKLKEVRVEALRTGFKQCYQDKDFKTIVTIGDRIPNNLLMEDEVLLQFYDIASSRI